MPEGFVYIDLAGRDELTGIWNRLKETLADVDGVTWQEPETFHITLAFSEDVSDEDYEAAVIAPFTPFSVRVSYLSVFNSAGERPLLLLVDHNDPLDELQNAVAQPLPQLSPYSMPERWQPHITLAYLPPGVDVPQIDLEPFRLNVDAVVYARDNYSEVSRVEAAGETMPDDKQDKMYMRPTQDEAEYRTLSAQAGQACANCRWYSGLHGSSFCFLIDNEPAEIMPTGWCNRWEAVPEMEPEQENVPARRTDDEMETGERGLKGWFTRFIDQRLGEVFGNKDTEPDTVGFKVMGNYWLATWSNNFEDREQELFTEKAHDDYITRVDTGITPPPELWVWHLGKEARIGQADWVARHGHFMIALGQFDETPHARRAKAYYEKHAEETRISHGFTFPAWAFDGKHYHQYNTFEITLLPRGVEANLFTSLEGVKDMAVSEDKRQYLKKVFGDDAEDILNNLDQRGKALEEIGVAFKDFSHVAEDEQEDSGAKGADTDTDSLAAVKTLLPEMFEGQAETVRAVQRLTKEVQGMRAELETLQQENETLRKELELTPPASRAHSTEVVDGDIQQQIADKEKGEDADDFWDFAKEKEGK